MNWLVALSLIAMVLGVLLIFDPSRVLRMNERMTHVVARVDARVVKYHIGVGVCLILASVFLLAYSVVLGRI